jgi:hypothetical protein
VCACCRGGGASCQWAPTKGLGYRYPQPQTLNPKPLLLQVLGGPRRPTQRGPPVPRHSARAVSAPSERPGPLGVAFAVGAVPGACVYIYVCACVPGPYNRIRFGYRVQRGKKNRRKNEKNAIFSEKTSGPYPWVSRSPWEQLQVRVCVRASVVSKGATALLSQRGGIVWRGGAVAWLVAPRFCPESEKIGRFSPLRSGRRGQLHQRMVNR